MNLKSPVGRVGVAKIVINCNLIIFSKWMDWIQKTLSKVNYCIEKHVPVKRANVQFEKPKWMDQYCVRKVKKKYGSVSHSVTAM